MPIRFISMAVVMVLFASVAGADPSDDAEKAILDLHDSGKLFKRAEYKTVRAAFAESFEARHEGSIRKAYGDDFDALTGWLKTRPELKHTFYTAIDEQHDDVPLALALFKDVWKEHPVAIEKWGNLAIAVAVVWDKPQQGVYDYVNHQVRTKSKLPGGRLDALENFKYLVDSEKKLAHPAHLYPWEFLTFVVDHRTPIKERDWAFGYYQQSKGKARWHQDVPYDHDMLKGEQTRDSNLNPKLAGKDYTLANIREFGGVCAQQADFAARTAKSLGVPAVYCTGKSAYRGLHAWWMHVHVATATKDEIKFSLVSDGRVEGFARDQFYTGNVVDPQTGLKILDRDLERRLSIVGSDRVGKRMTSLLARAYPMIVDKRSLDLNGKVAYLDKMLKINKHDEFAWLTLADMVDQGELSADQKKLTLSYLQSMSATFANYPDFIDRVLPKMLGVVPANAEKLKLWEQTAALYERAKRPDLACEARLRMSELLVADKKFETAGAGLVAAVRKFPTEGRYVPKLTAKLEELAPKYKAGVQQTSLLYLELLPAMILHYRNANDEYYKGLEKQGKAFLNDNMQTQSLGQLEVRIAAAAAKVGAKRAP